MQAIRIATAILIAGLIAPTPVPAVESPAEGAAPAMKNPAASSLEGPIWRLQRYKADGADRKPIASRDATLRFDGGRISGSGGCNRFMGSYDRQGAKLSIEMGGMTMMACPEGMEQEQAVSTALREVTGYRLDGDRLTLLGANSMPVLAYARLEALSLTGTEWRLTSYNNGKQGLASPLRGTQPTLTLAEGGVVQGDSGCNRFRGGYTLNRDWLAFGPIAGTRKACGKPDGVMEQERTFLQALGTVAKYKIEGRELMLINGDGKPAAKFRAAE